MGCTCAAWPQSLFPTAFTLALTHLVGKPHPGFEGVHLNTLRLDVATDILEEEDERVDRFEGGQCAFVQRVQVVLGADVLAVYRPSSC